MKASSMLGMSVGWALTSLAIAVDVGVEDALFWPCLAMTLPAVLGIGGVLRTVKKKPEPLEKKHLIGFGLLGAVLVVLSVLAIIAGIYWNKPPPADVVVDEAVVQ